MRSALLYTWILGICVKKAKNICTGQLTHNTRSRQAHQTNRLSAFLLTHHVFHNLVAKITKTLTNLPPSNRARGKLEPTLVKRDSGPKTVRKKNETDFLGSSRKHQSSILFCFRSSMVRPQSLYSNLGKVSFSSQRCWERGEGGLCVARSSSPSRPLLQYCFVAVPVRLQIPR